MTRLYTSLSTRAPDGNTTYGKAAIAWANQLVNGDGGLLLREDKKEVFDPKKRRLYYGITRDGKSLAKELVKAGLAKPDGKGNEAAELIGEDKAAATARHDATARKSQLQLVVIDAGEGTNTTVVCQ